MLIKESYDIFYPFFSIIIIHMFTMFFIMCLFYVFVIQEELIHASKCLVKISSLVFFVGVFLSTARIVK